MQYMLFVLLIPASTTGECNGLTTVSQLVPRFFLSEGFHSKVREDTWNFLQYLISTLWDFTTTGAREMN